MSPEQRLARAVGLPVQVAKEAGVLFEGSSLTLACFHIVATFWNGLVELGSILPGLVDRPLLQLAVQAANLFRRFGNMPPNGLWGGPGSMCVYACMYVHIYIYMCVCVYLHTHTNTDTYVYML